MVTFISRQELYKEHTMATIEEKIAFLSEEVNLLTTRIKRAGTGYLYTTIDLSLIHI